MGISWKNPSDRGKREKYGPITNFLFYLFQRKIFLNLKLNLNKEYFILVPDSVGTVPEGRGPDVDPLVGVDPGKGDHPPRPQHTLHPTQPEHNQPVCLTYTAHRL
jgi:hypothetical protein